MSRKNKVYQKNWKPDPVYNSLLVGRFVGQILEDGKKSVAEAVVYDSFEEIHKRTKKGGLNVFEQAIKNVSPLMELKSRRVGGANYQVPVPVIGDRRATLAMRWILKAASGRKGKKMSSRLADELLEASEKKGAAIKKKEDTHKMAESNKAFAHFA
ncbi:MAG: 30S ribosomal protein S7 [Patescibacteria group bacterium]